MRSASATVKFSRETKRHKPRAHTAAHTLPASSPEVAAHRELFFFAAHPDKWDFREAKGDVPAAFLPLVRRIPISAGVEGVGANMSPSRLRGKHLERGKILIDPNDPKLGPWQDYIAMYPVDDGGSAYVFVGCVPSIRSGGKVRWTPAPDWDDFRAHLVTEGIVPPPDDDVMGDLIRIQAKIVGRIRQKCVEGKRSEEELKAAEEKLSAMKALLREYQAEDAPPVKGKKESK